MNKVARIMILGRIVFILVGYVFILVGSDHRIMIGWYLESHDSKPTIPWPSGVATCLFLLITRVRFPQPCVGVGFVFIFHYDFLGFEPIGPKRRLEEGGVE